MSSEAVVEIGIDFGLFELIVAAVLSSTARFVFGRRWLTITFLVWSVAAPVALLFLVEGERLRWLVVACLVPAAVNVTTMIVLMRRHDIGRLLNESKPEARPSRSAWDVSVPK